MKSSEFSANSEQNWPWAESLDALVAARDHHSILFEKRSSTRRSDTRSARAVGSFAYSSLALRFVHSKLVSHTPPEPSGPRDARYSPGM